MKFGIIDFEKLRGVDGGGTIGVSNNSFSFGYIKPGIKIGALAAGSLTFGYSLGATPATPLSTIYSSAPGCLVFGKLNQPTAANYCYIFGNAAGSMAFGYSTDAKIWTNGKGSFAGGYATGVNTQIYTSAHGSMAFGYAKGAYQIKPSAVGSFAFGYAYSGNIFATAKGSFQFGQGTNAQAYSAGFGTDLRMNFTGVPGTPRNGDIWVANNYVYIRSNGVSKKIV